MEFPDLLSVLLYHDCKNVAADIPRLTTLAKCNGTNTSLQLFVSYFNKIGSAPRSKDQLIGFNSNMSPALSEAEVEIELEGLEELSKAYSAGVYPIILDAAEEVAARQY